MGMMRTAPKKGDDSGKPVAAAAAGAAEAAGVPCNGAAPVRACAPAAPEPDMRRRAVSTSAMVACLSGNTPTDMPLSKFTSKVEMTSSHPSAWVRLPASTSRLRALSARMSESAPSMGLRMVAISAAPMYCSRTTMAPVPGGKGLPATAWRRAGTMPRRASGLPTW